MVHIMALRVEPRSCGMVEQSSCQQTLSCVFSLLERRLLEITGTQPVAVLGLVSLQSSSVLVLCSHRTPRESTLLLEFGSGETLPRTICTPLTLSVRRTLTARLTMRFVFSSARMVL